MKSSKTVYRDYPGIGTVEFVLSRRARRLNIRVRNSRTVRVVVPPGIPFPAAYLFFDDHRKWVQQSQQRLRQAETAEQPLFDESFRTRLHCLRIEQTDETLFRSWITATEIRVFLPAGVKVNDENARRWILQSVIETYRREAKDLLPNRTAELAKQFQFNYNRLFIKNLKSRWGSCSARNNINLNLQLMRFDDWLIDYIILHELLHTRIRNHSQLFWKKLTAIYPATPTARIFLKSVKPYILY